MVYGNFDGEAVTEDRHCEPHRHLRRIEIWRREARHRATTRFRDAVHDRAAVGALRRALRQPAGRPGLHRERHTRQDLTVNGDGTDALDFTYIDDLVQGILRCIALPEARNQIFNLTYGGARTLKQMSDIVKEHFPASAVKHQPRDGLMPERGTLSIEKARRLIGYDPQYPLEKGFVRYIDWYKQMAAQNPGDFN